MNNARCSIDPPASADPLDPTPRQPLEQAEAALNAMMLLADEHGVFDQAIRQQCLSALHCLSAGRQKLRPRTVDERLAQVQRCIDAITRALPLEAVPAAATGAVRNWSLLAKPPVSRAPTFVPEPATVLICSEALDQTLDALRQLRAPLSAAEAQARFTVALTPAPFHVAAVTEATVLDAEGPDAELRRFVTGRVRQGRSPGQIVAAWSHAQQVPVTRALRRRVERMVARLGTEALLVDRRRVRQSVMYSCPPLVQALILKVALARSGATKVAIAAQVAAELPEWLGRARAAGVQLDVRPPSHLTVARYMARWSPIANAAREDGVTEALKTFKPVDRYSTAMTANSVWQLDHVTLDLAITITTETGREVKRPFVTALLDEATGVCVGWVIDVLPPNAFSTSRVLYRALTPWRETGRVRCCCPVTLKHDRGKDFVGNHVERILMQLGIAQDICPPHTPNARPEIERFFRSMHMGMSALPGFIGHNGMTLAEAAAHPDELLTIEALVQHLEDWTRESNTSVHAGARETPMQRWMREPGPLVPTDLAWRLLRSDVHRTIREGGIEFARQWYKGDLKNPNGMPLTELQQEKVRVYYSPDQPDRIWVTEWLDSPTGRPEAYLGMARAVVPGMPSITMAESYESTRAHIRAIARTATSMTHAEDAARQVNAQAMAAAPILNVMEHRATLAAATAQQAKVERRAFDAHTALLHATTLSFDDDASSAGSDAGESAPVWEGA